MQELALRLERRGGFSKEGETRLTKWMEEHLDYGSVAIEAGCKAVKGIEAVMIAELQPPLNLDGCKDRDGSWLRQLRKDCRDEASRASGLSRSP
jgi:hypothetical protein